MLVCKWRCENINTVPAFKEGKDAKTDFNHVHKTQISHLIPTVTRTDRCSQ